MGLFGFTFSILGWDCIRVWVQENLGPETPSAWNISLDSRLYPTSKIGFSN
jgi:hypothetical protein